MEDQENEANLFPKLKLPLLPLTYSPEHPSGTATPPLRTLVSVPFKWEEQPGKPRPCTYIIPLPDPVKFSELQLPPCRLMSMDRIIMKTPTPSPTAVLDGPYDVGRPKFSSSRFFREAHDSSDCISSSSCGITSPDEGADVDHVLLGKKGGKVRGYFGSFRFTSATSSGSSCDSDERCGWKNNNNKGKKNMRSNGGGGSFSSHVSAAKSTHIWDTICEGLKQMIPLPWKSSRKSNEQLQV